MNLYEPILISPDKFTHRHPILNLIEVHLVSRAETSGQIGLGRETRHEILIADSFNCCVQIMHTIQN